MDGYGSEVISFRMFFATESEQQVATKTTADEAAAPSWHQNTAHTKALCTPATAVDAHSTAPRCSSPTSRRCCAAETQGSSLLESTTPEKGQTNLVRVLVQVVVADELGDKLAVEEVLHVVDRTQAPVGVAETSADGF